MIRIKKFNELRSSTLFRAGQIAYNRNEIDRAERIWVHAEKTHKEELQGQDPVSIENIKQSVQTVMKSYVFNMFVHSVQIDNHNFREEDHFNRYKSVDFKKIVNVSLIEYGIDGDRVWLNFDSDKFDSEDPKISIHTYSDIEQGRIQMLRNEFTSKKDAVRFMELLNKIYLLEDPTFSARAIAKINNTDLKQLERNLGGEFYEFIITEFESWNEFENKIDIETLYDTY